MKIDNLEDIKNLIVQTENEQLEFKETTGQLERGMETLCAFLNGEGGTVLFGVTDKGKIIGQEVADVTKRVLRKLLTDWNQQPQCKFLIYLFQIAIKR